MSLLRVLEIFTRIKYNIDENNAKNSDCGVRGQATCEHRRSEVRSPVP